MHHRAMVRARGSAGRIRSRSRPGTDRLAGTVTNRQSVPLEDAMLAYGKEVYLLGNVEARGCRCASSWPIDRNLSGHLKSKAQKYISDQPWNRDSFQDRPVRADAGRDVPRQ